MNKVIALMGKAGSGKDTILHELIDQYPEALHKIISCTSRPPREGEKDGSSYFFLTEEQFLQKIKNKDMLEYTNFNNWYYGTSNSSLSTDKINIGIFNPTGIKSLMSIPNISLQVYYIQADDKTRLLRQLNRELYPDVKEIVRRFSADEKDFNAETIQEINYTILNNNHSYGIKHCADVISGRICLIN